VKENPNFIEENLNDICASVQRKLIDMLMNKLRKAAAKHKINQVAISGGVSANSELRKESARREKAWLENLYSGL
jgi:N6-L-threonylcarbamoyladenine synthase